MSGQEDDQSSPIALDNLVFLINRHFPLVEVPMGTLSRILGWTLVPMMSTRGLSFKGIRGRRISRVESG